MNHNVLEAARYTSSSPAEYRLLQPIGEEMYALISELFPICRSITGDGLRQTLQIVGRQIPLTVSELATGTQVFDWVIPQEWNIRDAYIKNSRGQRIERVERLHRVQLLRLQVHVVDRHNP